MKTRVPAVDGWFTMDEAAPALIGGRGLDTGSFYWPTALAVSGNPSAPGEERAPGMRTITTTSPLGSALVGAKEGDEIGYEAPGGSFRYRVVGFKPAGADS